MRAPEGPAGPSPHCHSALALCGAPWGPLWHAVVLLGCLKCTASALGNPSSPLANSLGLVAGLGCLVLVSPCCCPVLWHCGHPPVAMWPLETQLTLGLGGTRAAQSKKLITKRVIFAGQAQLTFG